jgi:hypothetical protein
MSLITAQLQLLVLQCVSGSTHISNKGETPVGATVRQLQGCDLKTVDIHFISAGLTYQTSASNVRPALHLL